MRESSYDPTSTSLASLRDDLKLQSLGTSEEAKVWVVSSFGFRLFNPIGCGNLNRNILAMTGTISSQTVQDRDIERTSTALVGLLSFGPEMEAIIDTLRKFNM